MHNGQSVFFLHRRTHLRLIQTTVDIPLAVIDWADNVLPLALVYLELTVTTEIAEITRRTLGH